MCADGSGSRKQPGPLSSRVPLQPSANRLGWRTRAVDGRGRIRSGHAAAAGPTESDRPPVEALGLVGGLVDLAAPGASLGAARLDELLEALHVALDPTLDDAERRPDGLDRAFRLD